MSARPSADLARPVPIARGHSERPASRPEPRQQRRRRPLGCKTQTLRRPSCLSPLLRRRCPLRQPPRSVSRQRPERAVGARGLPRARRPTPGGTCRRSHRAQHVRRPARSRPRRLCRWSTRPVVGRPRGRGHRPARGRRGVARRSPRGQQEQHEEREGGASHIRLLLGGDEHGTAALYPERAEAENFGSSSRAPGEPAGVY